MENKKEPDLGEDIVKYGLIFVLLVCALIILSLWFFTKGLAISMFIF